MRIRSSPMNELIHQDSESPNIIFLPIDVMDEGFWRHINRGSNVNIFEANVSKLSKSKISNLGNFVMKKDVGNFDISMDDVIFCQILQPIENVPNI
jgi:hypothetical protein